MNEWELNIENIGYFLGKHTFKFKPGANIVSAPNAAGKTSLLNAFQLLLPKPSKEIAPNFLNSSALTGEVSLTNGNDRFFAELVRTSNGAVRIRKQKLLTRKETANQLVFLTENHQLMDAVVKGDFAILKDWFARMTELTHYEKAYAICTKLDSRYRDEKDKESQKLLMEKHRMQKERKEFLSNMNEKKVEFERFQLAEVSEMGDPDLLEQFKNHAKTLDKDKSKLTDLKEKKRELNSLIPALKRKKDSSELELTMIGNEFSSAKDQIGFLNEEIERLDGEIAAKQGKLREINREISSYEILQANFTRTLTDNANECQHCGSTISKEILSQKLKRIEDENLGFKEEKMVISNNLSELKANREKCEKKLHNIKVGLPKDEKRLKKGIQKLINDISRKQGNLETVQESMGNLQTNIVKCQAIYDKLQAQLREESEKKQEIQIMEREIQGELKQLEKQLISTVENLAKIKTQLLWLKVYDVRRRNLKQITLFLQKKIVSVQENILDKINNHLEQMINELDIPRLRKIGFDDNFNIEIIRKTGIPGDFKELSGLERRLVAIIVGFSIKNAFLQKFPFFIIDETLHTADKTSFQHIVDYIGQKTDLFIVTRLDKSLGLEKDVIAQENILSWEEIS